MYILRSISDTKPVYNGCHGNQHFWSHYEQAVGRLCTGHCVLMTTCTPPDHNKEAAVFTSDHCNQVLRRFLSIRSDHPHMHPPGHLRWTLSSRPSAPHSIYALVSCANTKLEMRRLENTHLDSNSSGMRIGQMIVSSEAGCGRLLSPHKCYKRLPTEGNLSIIISEMNDESSKFRNQVPCCKRAY